MYAEVTEEGMKDCLAWFVAFRHAAQHGLHLTAFGVSTQGAFFLQSPFVSDGLPAASEANYEEEDVIDGEEA